MVLQKLLNGIKSVLNLNHPRPRYLYAVTGGKYLGKFFVYMESKDSTITFLELPSMSVVDVPKEKVTYGIENDILDPVKKLPNDVYNVCKAQYETINK